MNSPLTKHWFPLFMLFTFIAITALSLFIWYDLQRMSKGEQLDAEYTEQLQEELTPAYDESQMNPNAKM